MELSEDYETKIRYLKDEVGSLRLQLQKAD
jgi:hypothetical protein